MRQSSGSPRRTRRSPSRRRSRRRSFPKSRTWSPASATSRNTRESGSSGNIARTSPKEALMATETAVDVVMPQMGVSVSEGTITKWLKHEGEQVEADEALLEISTDKVDTEVPSPASGVVSEILVQEGETVEVGTLLARIGGEGSSPPRAARAGPGRAAGGRASGTGGGRGAQAARRDTRADVGHAPRHRR